MAINRIGDFGKRKATPSDAYLQWKDKQDDDSYAALSKSLNPVINSALMSFGGADKRLNVRAKILADQAIRSYDPEKGASLNSHVYNNLQRLQRFRAQRQRAVHMPENIRYDQAAVRRFEADYVDKHGVEPADDITSDALKMSKKRIKKTRAGGELSESAATSEGGDLMGSSGRTAQQVWSDYVYHDLDNKGKKIFEWTTGYGGAPIYKKKEIAKRLKITPAAISSRINTIRKKLEEGKE